MEVIIYEDAKIYKKGVVNFCLIITCVGIILLSTITMDLAMKLEETSHLVLNPNMIASLSISVMTLSTIVLVGYMIYLLCRGVYRLFNLIRDGDNEYEKSFFMGIYDACRLLRFDLKVISIKTDDGVDIKDLSDVSKLSKDDILWVEIESLSNTKFFISPTRSNRELLQSIIDVYLKNGDVNIELDAVDVRDKNMKLITPIEKMETFSLLNDKILKYIQVKEG